MSFVTATKIANRALQMVGSQRIATGALLTEQSKAADEVRACYDLLRRSELRRNVWRFSIRTVALRALNPDMQQITFGTWAIGTTYAQNDIVTGSDEQVYVSLVAANTGNDPTTTLGKWTLYFGPMIATPFVRTWSSIVTYPLNDIVKGSDGLQYKSLVGANLNHNPTTDAVRWVLDTNQDNVGGSFYAGEVVFTGGVTYVSLVSANATDPTTDLTGSWLTLATAPTLAKMNFIYPIGSGPDTEMATRNVFILPNGFMRQAPQAPKAAQGAFLGGPTGLLYDDWNFENNCFTSANPGPILFRFAADVSDPLLFDALFVEGFACRIALAICEPLTQSGDKLKGIGSEYKLFMTEARLVNGIETGPVDPPIDDYIAVRV